MRVMDLREERSVEAKLEQYGLPQTLVERRNTDTIELGALIATSSQLIIAAIGIGAIAAFALSFLQVPIYESRAVIEIGQFSPVPTTQNGVQGAPQGAVAIEPPDVVAERLKEEYGVTTAGGRQLPYLKDVRPNRQAKSIIALNAYAVSSAEAEAFLGRAVSDVLNRHAEIMNQSVQATREQLRQLNNSISAMNKQATSLAANARKVQSKDLASAVVLVAEQGQALNQIARLEQQRFDLLNGHNRVDPTRVLTEPTVNATPVAPNRVVYTMIGAITGLFVGVLLAIVLYHKKTFVYVRVPRKLQSHKKGRENEETAA